MDALQRDMKLKMIKTRENNCSHYDCRLPTKERQLLRCYVLEHGTVCSMIVDCRRKTVVLSRDERPLFYRAMMILFSRRWPRSFADALAPLAARVHLTHSYAYFLSLSHARARFEVCIRYGDHRDTVRFVPTGHNVFFLLKIVKIKDFILAQLDYLLW